MDWTGRAFCVKVIVSSFAGSPEGCSYFFIDKRKGSALKREIERYKGAVAKISVGWFLMGLVASAHHRVPLSYLAILWCFMGALWVLPALRAKDSWGYQQAHRLQRGLRNPPIWLVWLMFAPFTWPALVGEDD